MTEALLLLVKVSVGVLILAIGMGATLADLTYMWRRPGLLLLLALAIGHCLGGPHPDDRTALAIACATRHIGVAVIVATALSAGRAPWCSWRPTSWPRRWCRSHTCNGVAAGHVQRNRWCKERNFLAEQVGSRGMRQSQPFSSLAEISKRRCRRTIALGHSPLARVASRFLVACVQERRRSDVICMQENAVKPPYCLVSPKLAKSRFFVTNCQCRG